MEVKLADFGLARIFNREDQIMKENVGTLYYMAPEILEGKAYDERADLWSVGVILFQMVCGKVPFPAEDEADLRAKVLRGDFRFPKDVQISPICLDMICNLIVLDADRRYAFQTFLEHPFAKFEPDIYALLHAEVTKADLPILIKEQALNESNETYLSHDPPQQDPNENPSLYVEDLDECIQDIQEAVKLTIIRLKSIIKLEEV